MISIIVPCKNRIYDISRCIDSILLASRNMFLIYPEILVEIIIVNDNSEQGFSKTLLSVYPDIEVVDSPGVGPGIARNYGFNICKGEYVFFTDSDCIVDENWIIDGYNFFTKFPDGIVQGNPYLFQNNTNIELAKNESFLYKIMFLSYVDNPYVKMTDSRNLLIKKSNILSLGKKIFSEDLSKASAESRVFGLNCLKKNIKIYWGEGIKIYHKDPKDMPYVYKQKYRHGLGRTKIWESYPDFNALEKRYFDNPIAYGLQPKYVCCAHMSFLYGYFYNINNEKLLNEFFTFIKKIFTKYQIKFEECKLIVDFLTNA